MISKSTKLPIQSSKKKRKRLAAMPFRGAKRNSLQFMTKRKCTHRKNIIQFLLKSMGKFSLVLMLLDYSPKPKAMSCEFKLERKSIAKSDNLR